ncbi:MAG: cation:proton antiporter [Trueperaceae bacterium]|nr:cation:proton antiporter [Trueperaceae bacterium]
MEAILVFSLVLLVAVLISGDATRGILVTAGLFLLAGLVVGSDVMGLVTIPADAPVTIQLAEVTLFAILFGDGLKLRGRDLVTAWTLPGRNALFHLPFLVALIALIAHTVAGLPWLQAWLLGAALSPTDLTFAAATLRSQKVSRELRKLLISEKGVNDGLAPLTFVLLLAAAAETRGTVEETALAVVVGIGCGVVVPWLSLRLEQTRLASTDMAYEPLNIVAIALLVLSLTSVLGANSFVAAFAAGVTLASLSPRRRSGFERFGNTVSELLKLFTLFIFGTYLSRAVLLEGPILTYLGLAVLVLLVRPLVLGVLLVKGGLEPAERFVVIWFGPKGFASVVYGLLILQSSLDNATVLFHYVGLTITLSIALHSLTDLLAARWLRRPEEASKD